MAQRDQSSSPTRSHRLQQRLQHSLLAGLLRTPTGRWAIVAWVLLQMALLLMAATLSSGRQPLLLLAQKAALVGSLLIFLILILRAVWRSIGQWWARPQLMLMVVCMYLYMAEVLLLGATNPVVANLGPPLFIAGIIFGCVCVMAAALGGRRSSPQAAHSRGKWRSALEP